MRPPSTPRVEINCNLFKPCCSQETKVSVRKRGRNGGMGEGGIDLEPLRISNEFAGKKENREQTWGGAMEAELKVNVLKVYWARADYP